jgi:hypothetical protein
LEQGKTSGQNRRPQGFVKAGNKKAEAKNRLSPLIENLLKILLIQVKI